MKTERDKRYKEFKTRVLKGGPKKL